MLRRIVICVVVALALLAGGLSDALVRGALAGPGFDMPAPLAASASLEVAAPHAVEPERACPPTGCDTTATADTECVGASGPCSNPAVAATALAMAVRSAASLNALYVGDFALTGAVSPVDIPPPR